jgi:hypothetical protein
LIPSAGGGRSVKRWESGGHDVVDRQRSNELHLLLDVLLMF